MESAKELYSRVATENDYTMRVKYGHFQKIARLLTSEEVRMIEHILYANGEYYKCSLDFRTANKRWSKPIMRINHKQIIY